MSDLRQFLLVFEFADGRSISTSIVVEAAEIKLRPCVKVRLRNGSELPMALPTETAFRLYSVEDEIIIYREETH